MAHSQKGSGAVYLVRVRVRGKLGFGFGFGFGLGFGLGAVYPKAVGVSSNVRSADRL